MEAAIETGRIEPGCSRWPTSESKAIASWPSERFPYKLIGVAGQGSSAIVYHALDINLNREVAIKVLRPTGDWTPRRFVEEARAAATLHHPGAVDIYRVDTCDDVNFLVMEWVQGSTLERAAQSRNFSADQARTLIDKLLDVLAAAHNAGIIHRDIKPSNLLLADNGCLKVTDFGIARSLEHSLADTAPGSVLATPKFASPEQLSGRALDTRSDLFSAALVFYYLLSGGHAAFEGDSIADTITNILTANPVSITRLNPALPKRFDGFFRRALAKRPADRFQSARHMQLAVKRLVTGDSPLPPPGRVLRTPDPAPGNLLRKFTASWTEREADVDDLRSSFRKLLLERFCGVITLGKVDVFVADGCLFSIVDNVTGLYLGELQLPESARIHLKVAPRGSRMLFKKLALAPLDGSQQSPYHTGILDLCGLFSRLSAMGFSGTVYFSGRDSFAIDVFSQGHNQLLVLGGHWARHSVSDFTTWLDRLDACVSVHQDDSINRQLEICHAES